MKLKRKKELIREHIEEIKNYNYSNISTLEKNCYLNEILKEVEQDESKELKGFRAFIHESIYYYKNLIKCFYLWNDEQEKTLLISKYNILLDVLNSICLYVEDVK